MSSTELSVRLPREVGLWIRMLVALLLSLLVVGAFLGAIVWVTISYDSGWAVLAFLVLFVAVGVFASRSKRSASWDSREPTAADQERLARMLAPMALLADVPCPRTVVVADRVPLSWTTALRPSKATVHVTTGLVDRLDDDLLQAVIAHELGHIANCDGVLMTALVGSPSYVLVGVRKTLLEADNVVGAVFGTLVYGVLFCIPAALALAFARIVSRQRELAADRVAAILTGSPAAVAAALVAVDEQLQLLPDRDLRAVAPLDSLYFVPARPSGALSRIWAGHPSTAARVERLQRFEAAVQE